MFNRNYKNQLNDSFFDDINGCSLDISQRKVILDESDSLLVIAGAGSGKTLTIVAKIKYLIEKRKVNFQDILCISFTNETVNNLKKKVKYNVDCYTFHKLGLEIMKMFQYKYNIVCEDMLEYVVEEYFLSNIYNNGLMIYVIDYFNSIFEKTVTYAEIITIYYKQFILYKRSVVSFIKKIKCNNHNYYDIRDYLIKNKRYSRKMQSKHKDFLIIVLDIYCCYIEEINAYAGIDFDDMLSKSIELVNSRGMYRNYKYIIVDEFQDTSMVRYELIKSIKDKTKAKLMCVGDDYQSIYAFSGCDINIFINFKKYFSHAKTLFINKTYRNCYEIVHTSSKFIKKNPCQIRKKIQTNFIMKDAIRIIYYDKSNYKKKLYSLLDYLIDLGETRILVLGRNNKDILLYADNLIDDCFIYRNVKIKYLTVHRSKGLEEDNVILINANDEFLGFPNRIIENSVFELISKSYEKIPYAEERRLFYVALTRTKRVMYILADNKHVSPFVNEIMNHLKELRL